MGAAGARAEAGAAGTGSAFFLLFGFAESATGSALDSATGSALGLALGSALGSALDSALGSALGLALGSAGVASFLFFVSFWVADAGFAGFSSRVTVSAGVDIIFGQSVAAARSLFLTRYTCSFKLFINHF